MKRRPRFHEIVAGSTVNDMAVRNADANAGVRKHRDLQGKKTEQKCVRFRDVSRRRQLRDEVIELHDAPDHLVVAPRKTAEFGQRLNDSEWHEVGCGGAEDAGLVRKRRAEEGPGERVVALEG